MDTKTITEIIKKMPEYLAIKVRRVARDRNLSLSDAIIFLVRKGINAPNQK